MAVFKRGQSFYIDFYAGGKRIREQAGDTRRQAERALAIRKTEILQGRYGIKTKRKPIHFNDFAVQFLEMVKPSLKPSALERYRFSIQHLTAFFSDTPLDKINFFLIEQFKNKRLESVSNSTTNRDLACLRRLFTIAVKLEHLKQSPFHGKNQIEFLTEPKRSPRYLTPEQAERLLAECKGILKTFVILGLNTGLRTSEILGLKWSDVDLEARTVTPRNTKNHLEQPVPLNQTAVECLLSLDRSGEYVLNHNGQKVKSVRTAFTNAAERAGLGKISPHVLRHTWASNLVRQGVNLRILQSLGRWSSVGLCERYSHINDAERSAAVALLESSHKTVTNEISADFSKAINE